MTNSSWKVSSWTTPTTTVTTTPVPSEVSPESKSQISHGIHGQFASFIQENYPTFISFVKSYYKSQELKGYCFDIVQNWTDYYNIDQYGDLVTETKLISSLSDSSTTVDVESTRDFPNEGLLLIGDEIIYYQKRGQTLFQDCTRGFNAVKTLGEGADYKFEESVATSHALGTTVTNLNNIFPLYVLGKFKDQFLSTYPRNFYSGVTESTVIKRIKDFYSSKGSTRSFQFVLRTLFGVESEVSYPRDRIFKPSDAFYTSREVIRCTAVSGNPVELVGQVLYQENDPNDPNVDTARIYVKGVVEVFTATGTIYEIDVDTNNSIGTFVTPYKTGLSSDLGQALSDTVVTVDSTIGWPETNGRFRIEDEIISYTDKTVNQFIGCTRARENSLAVAHDAGQEVFAAFKIYGNSNVDDSEVQLKVYGGTRGVILSGGGKYYLPDSKVTTPSSPGFDSIDPVWDSFTYNVRRALRGESATLGTVANNGSVRCTVKTKEKHRLRREDVIRILNAPEDIYNNLHDVVGVIDEYQFEFVFSSSPAAGISGFEFYISREFAFGRSDYNSINLEVKDYLADVSNTYKSSTDVIVASTGIPSHKIGPFGPDDLDPGNQRYLKRIPLKPSTKSVKTPTPIGQVGISSNGVPLFSYKGEVVKKYGGLKSITKISGGSGYDITNPPTVEFEKDYKLGETYAIYTRVKYNGNRYQAQNSGITSSTVYPVHTSGTQTIGTVNWLYEGESAAATVSVDGIVTGINVTNGGTGYTTQPIVSITGGGASNNSQATATAQITGGVVTGISVTGGGIGYTSVPTVSISGGGGTGATAEAVCRGPVGTITITDTGSQYTYEPTINLISGSGAVAYPSILNGKIESIIVTFGGSGYFGAPDVVITGDGVGATAFAQVDLSTNIVTGVVVTNKGVGYSSGATTINIVYPGSGASFQTKLTELTYNESATAAEIDPNGNSGFVDRKVTDSANGGVFKGENFLIYNGEYGYFYNPKQLRFLLKDNIDENLLELTPTTHSPILGWAYDGHPIYGPYGFEDPENTSPYNSYKLMVSSYRIKQSRDALLSGLSDPMGTFIDDYEYVEGLGDLDQYNGRFCVTPDYPNGIYAYFCTIQGSAGQPAFPYFVGPNFYSEADEVNWDGNGLQKNFTDDAIRYKAPYIGTDNIVAKRKQLDNKIDFFLALEDTTTLIVMETGEVLTYLEDGIGYFSYFPVIRGGTADSLVVSSTNQYSSKGVDQYLVEGGGKDYKVNDRLTFDNTDTKGSGISGTVSTVQGTTLNTLGTLVGTYNDQYVINAATAENHYLVAGDAVTVSIADNDYTRTIKTKIISDKYHFEYFALQSMKVLSVFANTTAYTEGDKVFVADRVYKAAESGTSSSAPPTHESGTVSDGSMTWTYLRKRTDGNLYQGGWGSITGGSGYSNGTYTNVPLSTNGSGSGGRATIVVSGGAVTTVTITSFGTAYAVGDTISAADINIGNLGGSGFTITLTEVEIEAECHCDLAHQVRIGDIVNISGITPSGYNKTDYSVVRSETLRRFTIKRNFGAIAAATVTNAEVYVQEPKLQLILGHKYKFTTEDASNVGKILAFTLDPSNTDIFTYKNITDEVISTSDGEQDSITIKIAELPGIFYYFDLKGNISGSYFTVINDPVSGTQTVETVTDTTFTYFTALAPESGYNVGNDISYTTNSIYPSGGIATITLGDPGRNYASLPKVSGSTRSGSGATAVATISGKLDSVSVDTAGFGYNQSSLPTGVVTLPDFVDLTLTNVFGSFVPNEIIISQTVQGNQTARGSVISWNPVTSILRIKPLQNVRTGAANKGYIMFTTGGGNTGYVYSSDSQGTISAVSGIQAVVSTTVSGGGTLTTVTVNQPGSNYRSAPTVVFDDPYYGGISSLSALSGESDQSPFDGTHSYTDGTHTGITQTSVAPVNGTGAEFTVVVASNRITSITCTTVGTGYSAGDVITFDGTKIPGGAANEDFTCTVATLEYLTGAKATVKTKLDASVDSITITNSGSGYLSAPNIAVTGGRGINAKFNAFILNEGVSSINIENGGVNYETAPVVNITQRTGSGASILLKSSDMGEILKIGGDNITFNYSHDRTLKPELNVTYNLQLTRTQIIDYFDVINGGANFVSTPEIVLVGGSGSLYQFNPIIENEVIQSIEVINPGRGFLSGPTVEAKVTHSWVGLKSNSSINFPYNTKIPTSAKVTLTETSGQFPSPLAENTTYYAISNITNTALASNQIQLAATLADSIAGTPITFTSDPVGDQSTGQTIFSLSTSDLGDNIVAYMKPATFSVGERIYQGSSIASYTAYGFVKNWDAFGRVVSVEIQEGEFKVGEPVFGEETSAFGQIHAFSRADAVFDVSPISISASGWERTTGFLDINEQRLYDSDRYQEFSYDISSSININEWKNPLKFAAHPAGFKVVGTQELSQTARKAYRPKPTLNPSTDQFDWWVPGTNTLNKTFNGTTYVIPKPSAKNTGKLATINNFALGKPDYSAAVPTEVQIYGRQLLDIQKILTCISYKIDDFSTTTFNFDGSSSSIVSTANNQITLTGHSLVDNQRVIYNSGGDRFQDARDLVIKNIDYIVEETIGALNAAYPSLSYNSSTCARDIRLIVAAWANDLRYGGNFFSVQAVNAYVGQTVSQSNAHIDAANLIKDNMKFIAAEAVYQMLQDPTVGIPSGYPGVPGHNDNCIDDLVDGMEAIAYNLRYGGNSETWDAANFYVDGVYSNPAPVDGEETQAIWCFNKCKELCAQAIINDPITIQGNHGLTQVTNTSVTYIAATCASVDAAMDTLFDIITTALSSNSLASVTRTNPANHIKHIEGEETETIFAFNKARDLALLAVVNTLPTGTYTSIAPVKDFSITVDNGGCTDVKSAITSLSKILTDGIDNPSTVPTVDIGNYPDTRTGTAISGLTNGNAYYVKYVDANTIELRETVGASAINLSAVGTGVGHTLKRSIDGTNTEFRVLNNNIAISTKIGKTADKDQLFVIANGIVQNPANYSFANDVITFNQPLLNGTSVFCMYYDRADYTSSFQLDQIGDEIKTFDTTNGLTPGYGYSNGTYNNVPLTNRLGSGSGATADITVSGKKVTNVVLNQAGNGYTQDDVLGLSEIGSSLTVNYAPSAATYTPATGVLEMTIGSHTMLAPTTHTATGATYDPWTGVMTVTVANHGFVNGEKVKFDDSAIVFTCTHGGGTHAYPRATDPISSKWIPIFDVTDNTFSVQVLDTIPSTNTTVHTYSSAVTNAIKHAKSYIRIANNALIFSCTEGAGNHTYPRTTDPVGNLLDIPVDAVAATTITVNALNGTAATNTTTHTFQGLSTYQFQPTHVEYIPATGEMMVTVANHGMDAGDRIKFADNSLTFTCSKDNNTTNHTYPRPSDPVTGAWLTITDVKTDTFKVNVGENHRFQYTPTASTYNPTTGDLSLTIGSHGLLAPTTLNPTNAAYVPATGVLTLTLTGHSLKNGDRVKIADGAIKFNCNMDGGTSIKSYPRTTDPYSGKFIEVFNAQTNTFDLQVGASPVVNHDVTNATYNPTSGDLVLTIKDHGLVTGESIKIATNSLTFRCNYQGDNYTTDKTYPRSTGASTGNGADYAYDTAIAITATTTDTITVNVNGGQGATTDITPHTWNGGTASNAVQSGGNYTHTFSSIDANCLVQAQDIVTIDENGLIFTCEMDGKATNHAYPRKSDPAYKSALGVSAVTSDSITVNVGKTSNKTYTPSNAIYEPTTGSMELVIGNHDLSAGQSIKLADGAVSFSCKKDEHFTVKSYPRTDTSAHKLTSVAYTPDNGVMTVTSANHGMVNGDWIKLKKESITMTCDLDGNTSKKQYPRSTDHAYDRWLKVSNVTTNTFDVIVLDDIPSTNTDNHIFVETPKLTPHSVDYDATTGVMTVQNNRFNVSNAVYTPTSGDLELTIGAHDLTTLNKIRIAANSLQFSCPAATGTHTFVSFTGTVTDNLGQQYIPSTATYTPSTGDLVMTLPPGHGLTTSNQITIPDNAFGFSCDADNHATTHTYPRATDPASGAALPISTVSGNDITVNVGASTSTTSTYPRATGANTTSGADYAYDNDLSITAVTATTITVNVNKTTTTPISISSAHTFQGATSNCIHLAHGLENGDAITIDDNSISLNCTQGLDTKTYPRPSVATYTAAAPVSTKDVSTATYDAATGALVLTIGSHSYTAPTSHQATNASYNSSTGVMSLTIANHGWDNGDYIKIDDNALSFTCDYGGGTHTYVSGTVNAAITDNTSATHNVTDASYDPVTGNLVLTIGSHSLTTSNTVTVGANKLGFTCTEDNNATAHYYPRTTDPAYNTAIAITAVQATTITVNVGISSGTNTYPRTSDPISGEWVQIRNVTTNTFDIQVLDKIPSTNIANHTFVSCTATGIKKANQVRVLPKSLQFTCAMDGGVATKAYPRPSDPFYGRGMPITAVGGTTIDLYCGKSPIVNHTATGGTYDPTTGSLTLEIGAHSLKALQTVKLTNQGFTFQCAKDNYTTDHQYPRANGQGGATGDDPAYNTAITITGVTDTSITLNVGISPDTSVHRWKPGFTATNAIQSGGGYAHTWSNAAGNGDAAVMDGGTQYYADTGILSVKTTANHLINEGDWIKLNDGAVTLSCDQDNYATNHAYPRTTDPISGKWVQAFNCGQDRFEVNILEGTAPTNVTPHKFVSAVTDAITLKDPAAQQTPLTVSNVTSNTFDVQVLTKTPSTNTTTHSFVTALDKSITILPIKKKVDPFYDTALNISATTSDSITVNVLNTGRSTSVYAHKFHSALANSVITGGNYTHKFKSANAGAVKTGDRHSFVSATATAVERAIVSTGVYEYDKLADASKLIRDNLEFIATTAYGRMLATDPSFVVPSYSKCIRDTKLIIDAVADNIEYGGNDAIYDAAIYYASAGPLTGEEDETVIVFNAARDICREVMRNIVVSTNNFTIGTQVRDLTITNDSGNTTYDTNDCQDVASTITTLFAIATTAVGTTSGGPGNLNSVTRTKSGAPDFQIKVGTVNFDGSDTTFTAQVGGSTQLLPASDNFLIFLNSTLQKKGSTASYTYTGSTLTFTEAPLPGMDFYGFYFGKLQLLDDLAPYFDSAKKTFTMKQDNEPVSLESDNAAVVASNNLMIFLNGVFQEPGVAYDLRGSIIEFTEAPRAGSDITAFIYTGSAEDVFVSNTFNSLDPNDRLQILSEGSDRRIATVSSSTSIDSYEYAGLRPTPAEFVAIVNNGVVTQVNITNPGSNYEVAPILYFQGGEGNGASAETTIEVGSGKVTGVINLQGGRDYVSIPTVLPVHPVHVERKERNRIISDSNMLANSYLASNISNVDTTITLENVWYDVTQKNGFPDEAEVLIPYFDAVKGWTSERILYGAKNTSANTLTVATGGRGYGGTDAVAHSVLTGTYAVNQDSLSLTVTTGSAHNLSTDMEFYLKFTSGTNVNQNDALNYATYVPPSGTYKVSVTSGTAFVITLPEYLRRDNPSTAGQYLDTSYPNPISGNVSLLPEVRLRSL